MDDQLLTNFYQTSIWQQEQHPYLIEELLSNKGLQSTHTPLGLCSEIIGKLGEYTNLSNAQIAVLFNLEFVDTLMRVYRVNPANITFFADSELEAEAARVWYKVECPTDLIVWDAENKKINMPNIKKKFDVVVMNPPFAPLKGEKRGAESDNLFTDFIKFGAENISTDGYFCCVSPSSWMSPSESNGLFLTVFAPNTICYLNNGHAKEYFPTIGSSFTWFILQKGKTNKKKTTVDCLYKKRSYTSLVDMTEWDEKFLPVLLTDHSLSIVRKTLLRGGPNLGFDKSSDNRTDKKHVSKDRCGAFKFENRHTSGSSWWSSNKHRLTEKKKVLVSISGYIAPEFDDGVLGITHGCLFCLVDNKSQADRIIRMLNSNLFQFVLQHACKWSGWQTLDIFKMLPVPPVGTENMTDEEINEYFGISVEEAEFINEVVSCN